MRQRSLCLYTGLLLAALTPAAIAQTAAAGTAAAALPVTGVTLYTSGVGYFERGGLVDGDAAQTLLFPVGQINDVLKSLVLLDNGGGTIRPVTYGALDPVTKQLQAFSVDVSDNPDQATLLNRMRGASVTVSYAVGAVPKTLTGTIVGVQTQIATLPNGGGTIPQSLLTLLAEGSLHTVPLASVTDTQINDPDLRRELGSALAVVAQSRDASKRPVTLSFSGKGRRSVLIGYLTEAPLWQSSYRLVLGKSPVLQGWAMVQNTSQDDWNNVHLTLVSGRPISFLQDLYTPLYVPRPVVQASVLGSPTPQTYQGNLQMDQFAGPRATIGAPEGLVTGGSISTGGMNNGAITDGAPSVMLESRPSPIDTYRTAGLLNRKVARSSGGYTINGNQVANNSMSYTQALVQAAPKTNGAELGTALFTYKIAAPLSIGRQKSAMIPFVSSPVSAQMVSIFNPSVQSEHPLLGARLKNTSGLHLMGGPLTVFDESSAGGTGYVGDALVDDTEPGQTRIISYAVDLALDAHSENGKDKGTVVSVKLYKGNLVIKTNREQSRLYTVKNNSDKPRTVVIEHPYHGTDWTLIAPLKATERTAELQRFDINVAPHKSEQLTVTEAYPDVTVYSLLESDFGTLLLCVTKGEAAPQVAAALKDVIVRRSQISDLEAKISNLEAEAQNIGQGQTRIRTNMHELDRASALYRRYVGELDAQETQLAAIQTRKATLQSELLQAQNSLSNLVAGIDL